MMDVLADLGPYTVPILALAGLIILAGVVVWLGRVARHNRSHGLVAGHRLAVIDHIQIDENRRLVLIQRDDVQHLVVLGGGSDFLVESGIPAVHARAPLHPPVAMRGAEQARPPEPARMHEATLPHEPPRAEPARAAAPLDPHRFDPPHAGDAHRPAPARGEMRPLREAPPLPPGGPRPAPARPTPLPPEARGPVEPRPPMISRGPARDIGLEPASPSSAPASFPGPVAGPPFARRPLEPRVPESADPTRGAPLSASSPHPAHGAPGSRAEPVVSLSEPEAGARVTVKVDPLFAGMAEHLEETLRRPPASEPEPVRPATASTLGSPAFERALEKALDRPGRPVAAPLPAAPVPHAAMPAHAAPAPVVAPTPVLAPSPAAAVAATHPPQILTPVQESPATAPARGPLTGPPAVNPPAGPSDAPVPEVRLDHGAESASPGAPVRAIDMFAPEIRLTDKADPPRAGEDVDLFEEEMASLLGRNRRP